MKKKILSILIAVFIMLPCMLLAGCIGTGSTNLDDVDFRVQDGYVQYTTNGKEWQNLIDVDDIKGEKGDTGTGEQGEPGKDATYATYTINYDYGVATEFFETTKTSDTIKSTEWITTLPEVKDEYKMAFKGWFIAGTNKQVEKFDFVGGNCALEARFNIEAEGCASGLYQNGKYVKTWSEIVQENPNAFVNDMIVSTSEHTSYFNYLKGELVINNLIKTIGDYAFINCTGLTSIVMPNSITSIGEGAFQGCFELASVVIPNSVISMGNDVFTYCSELTSVVILSSANIGDLSFGFCYSLTSVVISSSATIGDYAFFNCTGLTSVVIPNSVTSIGDSAFYECDGLTSIVIPNSVKSIGNTAFESCEGLTSIVIPNSVTSIGDYAFRGCSGLASIVVESCNTIYDNRENCNAIIETATNTLIAGCKNTIIPNSVASIGDYAFCECDGLTSIVIPNSVTSIGECAFYDCGSLTSVVIESENISKRLSAIHLNGYIIENAQTVYIKTGLSVANSAYLLENFTKQETSDKVGYDMYVRNS